MASWAPESWALVATGGLLALVVIASLHPRVALSGLSRTVFLAGGLVFIAFAVVAEELLDLPIPSVVLVLPLVPLAVTATLVRRARVVRARAGSASATGGPGPSAPHAATAPHPAAAPVSAPFDATGADAPRLLATSPYATGGELARLAYTHPELRTAIASNPAAPAALLQWLMDQGEPAVLAAIAARGRLAG